VFSPKVEPKTKNPLGLSASGPMSTFSSLSLGTTQRARHVAVMMMMPVRPEMIRNAHLLSQSLNKPARRVNRGEVPKNRYDKRVFWMLAEIDFPASLRYFH
jgi:hypothetical protein